MRLPTILLGLCMLISLSGCTSLFFQPQKNHVLSPERFELEYQDVNFKSADGVMLHGWYLPAQGKAKGTVLFLHGNAENISTHILSIYWLPGRGYNVFIIDYRGYGRSQGQADVAGALADIEAALQTLIARPDIDPDRIVVLGQSLGGALAISAVAQSQLRSHIKTVVVDSAFSSYSTITREKMADFWLTWPLQWIPWLTIDDSFSPVNTIAISCSLAAAITSLSRIEPPGWMTARIPAFAAASMPSRNGKKASLAITEPGTTSPASSAFNAAIFALTTRLICPAPMPTVCKSFA